MSGLAGLLSGQRPAGVYTWKAGFAAEDVRGTVEQAGFGFAYLDGWKHQTKGEVLVGFGAALGLPRWYGANLDALEDCLRDLDSPATVLLWDGWSTLARAEPEAFTAILEIFSDAAQSAQYRSGAVSLLLRGQGPEIAVPALDD